MSYQYEIAKCARKFKWPSWVIYNINFRQEAASYPTLSWAEAAGHWEPKIYQQCFNGMEKDPMEGWCRSCLSLDHTTSLYPSALTMPQQPPFLHQRNTPWETLRWLSPSRGRYAEILARKGTNIPSADAGMSVSNAMEVILNTDAPYDQYIREFLRCNLADHLRSSH